MNKLLRIVFFFILIPFLSIGQTFQLSLQFEPSWMDYTVLKFYQDADSTYFEIKGLNVDSCDNYPPGDKKTLNANSLNKIKEFMNHYKYFSDETYYKVYDPGTGDSLISVAYNTTDGMHIKVDYKLDFTSKQYDICSFPGKTSNDSLIKIVFDIIDTIPNPFISYFDRMKSLFLHFDLRLDTLSAKHHKYKLSGYLTNNESYDLIMFFIKLPSNKKIEIDLSGFVGARFNFADLFLNLSNYKKVTWVNCSYKAVKYMKDIGVSEKQIKTAETSSKIKHL